MTYHGPSGEASLTTVNTEILPADRKTGNIILDDSSIRGDKRGTSVRSKSLVALNETSNEEIRVINSYLDSVKASDEISDKVKTVDADPVTSEVKQPEGIALVILTIALMLAVFMMSLDKSIIAIAIPKISTEFQSFDDIGWYTSAYLLPLMALQPIFGKIYTFFNIKIVFLCALLCFEIGSIICATARSSPVFILGRVIAGSSAAAIQGGGMMIIALSIPLHKVPLFLGSLTSMTVIAGLTGPPLGGLFTDLSCLTWRFCFWINLPFGGLAAAMFFWGFKAPVEKPSTLTLRQKLGEMSVASTLLFLSSMTCLFLSLEWGGTDYSWSASKVWGLVLGSGLLLAAFIALQIYLCERAMIPPRIFVNRSLTLSLLTSSLLYFGTTVHIVYLPFYFQSAKGISATASGLRIIPYTVSLSVSQIAVGSVVAATGFYLPFMWSGAAVFTIGSGLLSSLTLNTDISHTIGYQILAGYGIGSAMQLCATSVLASLKDKKDIPISSVLTIFAPMFGGSLAAAIAQNVFRIELAHSLQDSVAGDDAVAIVAAGGTYGVNIVGEDLKGAVQEAYCSAVSKTFLLAVASGGIACFCTLWVKWKNIKASSKVYSSAEGN